MKKIETYRENTVSVPNVVYDLIMKARSADGIRVPRAEIEALRRFKSIEVHELDTYDHDDGNVETQWSIDMKDREFEDGSWEDGEVIEVMYSVD